MTVQQYLKAITAAIIAGLGAASVALDANNHITWSEGIKIATTVMLSLYAVWATPNKSTPN